MATPREQACLDAQAAINKAIECLDRVECRGDEAIEEMQQELRIVEENVAQLAEETATPCADCETTEGVQTDWELYDGIALCLDCANERTTKVPNGWEIER